MTQLNTSSRDFDCVVVGGGPAGSVAGAYLARAGLRALVVEKERFPRFHIGESLLPAGNAILREIGVWEKVEASGFVRKYGAEFHVGDQPAMFKRIEFSAGLLPGCDYTYQVERSRFDKLLLDHAGALGCAVRQETKATAARALDAGEGWEIALESTTDPERVETVRAGWIIDAAGRDNIFTHPLKTARVDSGGNLPKRAALYAHFRGVARQPGKLAGNILIVRHADGWFWLIPIDAARTSVGLVVSMERMKSSRLKPAALFEKVVAESPKLRQLMAGAEPATDFFVTADFTYRSKNFAGPRLLLVGDAAGFFDPIFSSGVFLGLHSARLAAAAIVRAEKKQAGRALSAAAQRRYTRALGQACGVFQKLICAFYDNASYAVFVDRHPPLGMGRAVNSVVAGNTRLPFRVWWRYQLFLLICRLQRRWTFVPRIEWETAHSAKAMAAASPMEQEVAAH
ncbi:MAG: tryptophan 7-halogenase [Verrucomicrobia bacterium]|nr:tryptophan 7-halogenase [Verrucomicrobiota bacterium]